MAFKLLKLHSHRFSLEFPPHEFGQLQSKLRRVARRSQGRVAILRRSYATFDELIVGRARLILMTDLGEPCLISTDVEGDKLLRETVAEGDRGAARGFARQFRRPTARPRKLAA